MFMGHTFGIPHRALRDTKFRGFNIPKVSDNHRTILKKNKTIFFAILTFSFSFSEYNACRLLLWHVI